MSARSESTLIEFLSAHPPGSPRGREMRDTVHSSAFRVAYQFREGAASEARSTAPTVYERALRFTRSHANAQLSRC